eukprot:365207_1
MMSKILILTILFAITHTADFDVETNNFYVKEIYGNTALILNGHDLAQEYCETKFGTTLATIDTPEKSQELFDALSTSYLTWYWIGLKGSAGGGKSDTWRWLDGTPRGSYINWRNPNAPDIKDRDPIGEGPCVEYYPTQGWNDYPCTGTGANSPGLICNKAAPIYVKFLVDVQLDHLSNGQACDGDCDGNTQCGEGLLCLERNGDTPFPLGLGCVG